MNIDEYIHDSSMSLIKNCTKLKDDWIKSNIQRKTGRLASIHVYEMEDFKMEEYEGSMPFTNKSLLLYKNKICSTFTIREVGHTMMYYVENDDGFKDEGRL